MTSKTGLRIAIGLSVGMALLLQPAKCQKPGAGGTAGGGGVVGSRPTPSTTTAPNPNTQPTSTPDIQNRSIFLSGRVQMDDGTPPPEPVVIERICNGHGRAEGYTDAKGRFSFQLGQNLAVTQDASFEDTGSTALVPDGGMRQSNAGARQDSTGAPRRISREQDLTGCELRAVLPGFRSDLVNLGGRRMLDNPEVGSIVLHRVANVEGTTISATTLLAPKDARKAYEKAREALRKGKTADAQKDLDKAVTVYPQFAAAWTDLGMIHEKANDVAEARKCYSQALAADPKLVTPYLRLAQLSMADKNWQEAADTTGRIVRLNPVDFPEAYFYNAVAKYNLRKFDEAETSAREAQKLDIVHRFPQVEHILGVIFYQKKDYAGAAAQMRKYLLLAPDASDAGMVKQQLAEVDRLSGGETKAKVDNPQP